MDLRAKHRRSGAANGSAACIIKEESLSIVSGTLRSKPEHHHLEALTYRSIWQRQQFATLVAAAEVITQDTSGSSQIGAGRNRDAAREG